MNSKQRRQRKRMILKMVSSLIELSDDWLNEIESGNKTVAECREELKEARIGIAKMFN